MRNLVGASIIALALAACVAPGVAAAQTALTQAHARSAMTDYGCANVSSLSPGPNGSWHGQCSKGGATVNVMMDSAGKVTSGGMPSHITESSARSAATDAGCNNTSVLSAGPNGSWHGQCSKGGATVNVAVDSTGKVTTGQMPTHLTEGNARSILTDAGCASISSLNSGPDGSWVGQCAKGGKLSNVSVDSKGTVTAQ